jgi:general stress protein YciG
MAKDHDSSVKDDKQYEGLRKKGMSKERAAKIANTSDASKKGGKSSGGGGGGGGKDQQKAKAGRKGGKKSS